MLSHEETMALILSAQSGDAAAKDALTAENLALVRSVVKRYLGRGAEYDDLFQLGSMGLVKAIARFDPSYEVRFSTYAVPMIAGEIKRFLRDDGPVKVGRSVKELASRALAVRDQLADERGAPPGVVEIAAALGVPAEELAIALDAARPVASLSERVYDEDSATIEETLASPQREETLVDRLLIVDLLGALEGRERQIIVLRYFCDQTQTQVAERLGISQVQVSRLESKILKKMRARAADRSVL